MNTHNLNLDLDKVRGGGARGPRLSHRQQAIEVLTKRLDALERR